MKGAQPTSRRRILATVLIGLALTPWSTLADPPPGKGRGRKQRDEEEAAPNAAATIIGAAVFSALEIQRIRSYYATRPPAGGKPLPPGIAKNLARGKPLPPGIAKRYAPRDLTRQLSGRTGYEVIVAGTSILLVEAASRIIRDIVSDAVAR